MPFRPTSLTHTPTLAGPGSHLNAATPQIQAGVKVPKWSLDANGTQKSFSYMTQKPQRAAHTMMSAQNFDRIGEQISAGQTRIPNQYESSWNSIKDGVVFQPASQPLNKIDFTQKSL